MSLCHFCWDFYPTEQEAKAAPDESFSLPNSLSWGVLQIFPFFFKFSVEFLKWEKKNLVLMLK